MLRGKKVILCPKEMGDAINDYNWAKDTELASFDAVPPLDVSFDKHLVDYVKELAYPSPRRLRFAIKTMEEKHIGNCGCYDIDKYKGEVELGIMIGDRAYWGKGYGSDAVTTLLNHIFRSTKLERVYLKTLDWNIRARKCFEKCGFLPCGQIQRQGYDFVIMDIHRRQWQDHHSGRHTEPFFNSNKFASERKPG